MITKYYFKPHYLPLSITKKPKKIGSIFFFVKRMFYMYLCRSFKKGTISGAEPSLWAGRVEVSPGKTLKDTVVCGVC